jgi:magnesium-transporting ATPase (P-type)
MLARFTWQDWLRYIGFVLLNAGVATYGTYTITQYVKAISDEGMGLIVLPMAFISLLVFAILYPVLRGVRPGLARLNALYLAFVGALFTLAIVSAVPMLLTQSSYMPLPQLVQQFGVWVLLIVCCGHLYGWLPLLGIAAMNKMLSPVFFPRPATSS